MGSSPDVWTWQSILGQACITGSVNNSKMCEPVARGARLYALTSDAGDSISAASAVDADVRKSQDCRNCSFD